MPFAAVVHNDEPNMYASLCAPSQLWAMDCEVNCARYDACWSKRRPHLRGKNKNFILAKPTPIQCGSLEGQETVYQETTSLLPAVIQLKVSFISVDRHLAALNLPMSPQGLLIGGFHVTQVSLIITQVKNKIAYHSIN